MEGTRVTSLNISLPDPMKKFIESQVKRGSYKTPSDYVRHLLREEQKRQMREQIDKTLLESLASGDPIPGEVVMARLRKRNAARSKTAR
jgi:antitoxin ParD1/3/4